MIEPVDQLPPDRESSKQAEFGQVIWIPAVAIAGCVRHPDSGRWDWVDRDGNVVWSTDFRKTD